jgi:hypothetical protein
MKTAKGLMIMGRKFVLKKMKKAEKLSFDERIPLPPLMTAVNS